MSWYKLSGQQLTVCINSLYSSSATSPDLFLFILATPHMICGILVPQPGIKLSPSAVELRSPTHQGSPFFFFFFLIYYPKEIFMDYAKISI